MAEDNSPADKTPQPQEEQQIEARHNLVESLVEQVLAGVQGRLIGEAPSQPIPTQPQAQQQQNLVPVPVPRPVAQLPTLRNHNYAAQVSFAQRIFVLLSDASLAGSANVQRALVLLRRRIATLIAGDSDFSVFEELDKFERSEGIEATLDDDFANVLRERAKASAGERKSGPRKRDAPSGGFKRPRGFGGAAPSMGGIASASGHPAGFPFPSFPDFPPIGGPPFQPPAPQGAFQPSSSGACFICGIVGHRARNCPNSSNANERGQ